VLWLAAWAAVVVVAQFAPLGVAIAFAAAVFVVQVLTAPGRSCHLPGAPDRGPPERDRLG
jgi:hypothetical protein